MTAQVIKRIIIEMTNNNASLSEQLSSIVHNLKNPTGVIRMICEYQLEILNNNNQLDKTLLKNDLEKIIGHTGRIFEISNDIRKISKDLDHSK